KLGALASRALNGAPRLNRSRIVASSEVARYSALMTVRSGIRGGLAGVGFGSRGGWTGNPTWPGRPWPRGGPRARGGRGRRGGAGRRHVVVGAAVLVEGDQQGRVEVAGAGRRGRVADRGVDPRQEVLAADQRRRRVEVKVGGVGALGRRRDAQQRPERRVHVV